MPAFCGFYRIDIADYVGDRHIGRGKFFDKTVIPMYPIDLCFVSVNFERLAAIRAQRSKRIVVYFASGNDRNLIVEQLGQLANDARLRLAPQAQQNKIMLSED